MASIEAAAIVMAAAAKEENQWREIIMAITAAWRKKKRKSENIRQPASAISANGMALWRRMAVETWRGYGIYQHGYIYGRRINNFSYRNMKKAARK